MNALQAYQLASAASALTQNFGPASTNQARFASQLGQSAGEGIQAENAKKMAKKKKGSFLDTALNVASMIPGPQQPFVMAGNAIYKGTQGDISGAASSGVGAVGGFQDNYGTSGAANMTAAPDPVVPLGGANSPGQMPVYGGNAPIVQTANLAPMKMGEPASGVVAAPPANAQMASPPPVSMGAPPSGVMNTPPLTATPGPATSPAGLDSNVASMLGPAVVGGAVALGTRYAQNQEKQPTAADVMKGSESSNVNFNTDFRRVNNTLKSMQTMTRKDLNSPRGKIMSGMYLDTLAAGGQMVPQSTWSRLPHDVKVAARNNPKYRGIIPSKMDSFMYGAAPILTGLAAGGLYSGAQSQLQPSGDGSYNYIPGG
jgi:hypothetical protein